MSTTLLNAEIALSKDIGDYWSGTTTSAGAAGGTTLIDTALMSKNDDWIDTQAAEMYDQITSGTYDTEEKRITALSNTTGTLTVAAHTGQIASGVTYRVHRLWNPADKRLALIDAAKQTYPHLYKRIYDKSKVAGNWLKDGSFEVWTSSSALTYWTKATSTLAQTSTAGYYVHGSYSCKIDTAAGNIKQSISNNTDLEYLRGKTVTFSIRGWCNTASALRIGIYDGSDYTYSDYHDGDSAWTDVDDRMEVTATISEDATVIEFYIYLASAAATVYVDDARVISGRYDKVYIGDLGLALNLPTKVSYASREYEHYSPDVVIRNYHVENGYLYLEAPIDSTLTIEGIGYLDFLLSGVASTSLTATIDIDSPQLSILSACAACILYRQRSMPTMDSGTQEEHLRGLAYWEREYQDRIRKFRMPRMPVRKVYTGEY